MLFVVKLILIENRHENQVFYEFIRVELLDCWHFLIFSNNKVADNQFFNYTCIKFLKNHIPNIEFSEDYIPLQQIQYEE